MKKTHTIFDSRFRQDNFEEWKKEYIINDDNAMTFSNNELMDIYYDELMMWLTDEEVNLDKRLDGEILAYADLGFWNGRRVGVKSCGTNLSAILNDVGEYDDTHIYCDRHNVYGDLFHHDGTHYLMFRIAKSERESENIKHRASCGDLTRDYFLRHTTSIVKHVNAIYGW